ncbi:hypothetical protein MMC25_008030 [Agyrium rufum]|nr:hypothetical protein [Agyrium rufum]
MVDLRRSQTKRSEQRASRDPHRPFKRPLIPLHHEQDNPAKKAWRSRRPHAGETTDPVLWWTTSLPLKAVFELPTEFLNHFFKNQGQTSNLLFDLERIGKQTGTFVESPANFRHRRLQIWGPSASIPACQAALLAYVKAQENTIEVVRNSNRKRMPSIHPQSVRMIQKHETDLATRAKSQAFRREPPADAVFSVVAAYVWEFEDYTPVEVFGSQIEALDEIRVLRECYISYEHENSLLRLSGHDQTSITSAIDSIDIAVHEFLAGNAIPIDHYFVQLPSIEHARQAVILETFEVDDIDKIRLRRPRVTGEPIAADGATNYTESRAALETSTQARIRNSMAVVLSQSCYHRGFLELRSRIGKIGLKKVRWDPPGVTEMPVLQFAQSVERQTPEGVLIRELDARGAGSVILAAVTRATHLLEPLSAVSSRLEDVTADYFGHFLFKDDGDSDIRLSVGTTEYEGEYEISHRQWIQLPTQDASLLQVSAVPLEGNFSWRLQLTKGEILDPRSLDPSLITFSDRIRCVGLQRDITSGKSKCVFNFHLTPQGFISFKQKTAYRFRMKANPAFIFEVARYDRYSRDTNQIQGTDWGATLYLQDWNECFSANETMARGEKAPWEPTIARFFPLSFRNAGNDAQAGIEEHLVLVNTIVDYLNTEAI